ncbi:hypothetical protein CDD83_10975 [Cordyceps sp. RAO-2017]|nr:hypothetical protein CDD83_10975 [Cordyceps sp. RAO-2017]
MYEDSWYSFVPEIASRAPASVAVQPQSHRRNESLAQQPNGAAKANEFFEQLQDELGEPEGADSPPEPTLIRRPASYSDFYHVVRAQLAKDAAPSDKKKKKKKKRTAAAMPGAKRDRSWDALMLCDHGSAAADERDSSDAAVVDSAIENQLLEASQEEYLLYQDQLMMTERHLEGLIEDADATLKLLSSLSNSFQSVEAQTSSFRAKCEGLISEQRRLEKLADDVGTDLHYYAYLETATRRLNAPGASRLVDDDDFGEMVENIDACVGFMTNHESYRERDSYLARYNALLTKALHLLDRGFTALLEKVSQDIGRQIGATKSESARHALAYGRFEEMMTDSFALLPNIRKLVRCAYDQYGRPVEESPVSGVYANSAASLFRAYLTTRDRDLRAMTQHDLEEFRRSIKPLSVETACRNFIKQSFDKVFNEDGLFVKMFGVEPAWSNAPGSAFQAIKAVHTAMAHPGSLAPLATSVQAVLQAADLQAVCNVVGWLSSEYAVSDGEDEESLSSSRKYREYAARLLVEHLWAFTDSAFAAEVTRSISKAPLQDDALRVVAPAASDGTPSSNAHPLVRRAIELLAMFDQAMPKERSAKNSAAVFNIVREAIQVLQRAEGRMRSLKAGADADLFMIQNLLVLKNELFSLEIGDIRSDAQPMQHFGRVWDALSPQNWLGFFGGILGGAPWSRGGAPAVTATTLTAEDMNEQLDELLRQSIYAFTRRWAALTNEAHGRGAAAVAKVEAELEALLGGAFHSQPEVVAKLKEAIRLNAQAQNDANDAKRGAKRY